MAAVAETSPKVSPLVTAALLIAARTILVRLGMKHPKVSEILAATGAGRSRVYELAEAIPDVVADLVRPPGRPPAPPPEPAPAVMVELSQRVVAYLIEHPGCVTTRGRRHTYTDDYRLFVIDLAGEHEELDITLLAKAVAVPLPTLRDWLRGERPEPDPPDDETIAAQDAASARIQTVIRQWLQWSGPFGPFCDHLREHLRIEWGRTLIGDILEKAGVRLRRRRPGRARDDGTLRGAFETFFPGAQWQGDGSSMSVCIGPYRFTFNVELMVDADSGAFVGLSIRDEEDSAAVVQAFDDGVETTGSPPLAVELDGRPSNHTDEVDQGLGETMSINSTPGKPQSNPHVEGAFGLFEQTAPPLVVDARDLREAARQVLALVLLTWARTLNHKPRVDRGGRSRVDLYSETEPSADDVDRARKALRERVRRQELAAATLRARQDPVVRQVLDLAFEHLGLDDPKGLVRAAIARHPLDHVLAGLAIYEGKARTSTLPSGVDARYLLGIIRNVSKKDEGQLITEALIRLRLEARDLMLAQLTKAHEQLLSETTDHDEQLRAMVDAAMVADRQLDRAFWLEAAAEVILGQPESEHADLVRAASRCIHATFAVPYEDRLAAARLLTRKVIPLV